MSDQFKEIAEIPRDFLRDGTQFINRCTKPDKVLLSHTSLVTISINELTQKEFIKISQAVGTGFLIMGIIGYVVKLSEFSFFHDGQEESKIAASLTIRVAPERLQ
ncbi:Sec61p translocation complex subunit [Varicellaria rhodocarpa]|nr:Sec61p translocation complex subunit [Varicellaria rhodocarpa]